MRPIVTDVCVSVRLSVCVLITRMCCAKTVEPIEMPFEELTNVGSRSHILDVGQDQTNPFAAR